MKVCFDTFGCRLNKAEALQMEADYLSKGWELTDRHADADLIVVRGCSVTQRAQSDCENLVAHLKKRYPKVQLRVCGCLKTNQAKGIYVQDNLKTSPFSDIKARHPAIPTRTARAYLKVQDGCNGLCAFCIVPQFRGKSVSLDFDSVLDRAKGFLDAGYHEIVVTGCNLTQYASAGKRLPELLSALADVAAGRCRIRLGSITPGSCAEETLQAMAEHKNVCRFLHLSVQSGSNVILQMMKRTYTVKDIDQIVALADKLMPKLGLGCDLIAGFPGETNVELMATKALLTRLPFTNAHVFPFSERPGTAAVNYPNKLTRLVKHKRAHEIVKVMEPKRALYAKSFIGKTVDVVVETDGTDEVCRGWTGEYLPCEIACEIQPRRKELVRVIVLDAEDDTLYGNLI